jgi:hypothetical protein
MIVVRSHLTNPNRGFIGDVAADDTISTSTPKSGLGLWLRDSQDAASADCHAPPPGPTRQVAAMSWTPWRLVQPRPRTSIGSVSGYWDAHTSSDRVRRLPVVHSQCRSGHRFCGVPGDVSLSVHVCADCAADVIGGRRRRMDLRPYGIGENGGYLEVADHPRPPCRRQAERPAVACSRTSGVALGHAPNGPPALDRPWVPVRRLIPVGSSPLCPDRLGSRHVGSQPTTSNQRTGEPDGEHPSQRLVRQ